jgi:tetratricopeptide (TPR) repeat protein
MPRVAAPWLCLPLSLLLFGDHPERGRTLLQLVPGLEPRVAGHLVADSAEEFRAYCRGIGPVRTLDNMSRLNAAIRIESPESYARSLRLLFPYMARMADVMSDEFDRPEFAHTYHFRLSLGDRGYAHKQALLELEKLQANSSLGLAAKITGYAELADRFARFGDERELMNIDAILAREVMREGWFAQRVRLLRSALARARRLSEHHMICQLLGEMGEAHLLMGHRDSVVSCYQEGIAHADAFVIPEQAARIRRFLARFYLDEGHLAAGAALLQEAMASSRPFGGSPLDISHVLSATDWYARLQCWDMVERNTQRFPALLRALGRANYPVEAQQYGFTARRLRAACLAAKGHTAEAADSLQRLFADARTTARHEILLPVLRMLADVQLQAGQVADALATAEFGVALAERTHQHNDRRAISLLLARAAIASHRPDLAEQALAGAQRYEKDQLPIPRIQAYVVDGIAARIALERDDARRAERLLRRGLASLRDSVRALDRGPLSDLTVQAAPDLWLAGHRLLAGSARRELAFERHWRSLVSAGGRPGVVSSPAAHGAAVNPTPPRTLQLLYATMPEGLVRWTATSGGVRREVLALDPLECRRLVDSVFAEAATDPGAPDSPMPAELRGLARRLGQALLPQEVRDERFDRVAISAEGALGRLAFELLDVASAGDYVPLLARMDVRYARHVRPRPVPRGRGPSLILADHGVPNPRGARRQPLPALRAVDAELARASASLPDVRIVRGSETSKQALLQAWSRASIVYVAAHLVRDDDAPLFNYFPIAFGAASRTLEDDYLDIRDVRDTDLSRCRLVVLSSCASGEPYVAGTRSGPSMADAFLDAGADAVIHTRWRVRDESAAETAPRLAKAWLDAAARGSPKWRAARLDRMRGPRGIRHPFEWAAWSITTAVPVPDWNGAAAPVVAARLSSPAVARRGSPSPSPAPGE